MDHWVSLQQAARVSGRDRKDLHRSIIEGDLPAIPVDDDRMYLVRLDDISPALRVFYDTEPDVPQRRGSGVCWTLLLILGFLVLSLGLSITWSTGCPRSAFVRTQVSGISDAVTMFELENARYPTGLRELTEARCPYVHEENLTDSWGNRIVYRVPGTAGAPFDLFSLGPDGVPSDDDIWNHSRRSATSH